MVHTIEPIEVFSGDHAMLVIDMVLKGYTKGASKGVTNIYAVDESTQVTHFYSDMTGAEFSVVGDRILDGNEPISIHDIPNV